MANKFNTLRLSMSPSAQEKSKLLAKAMQEQMPLNELRQARGLSQETIATLLSVKQPSVAKMEKNVDMYISTLRKYIQAMGGDLDITASFPDGRVRIANFADIDQIGNSVVPIQ